LKIGKNMIKIRFLKTGKRNQPTFKIVVINSQRAPQSGRFIEEVGFFNPQTKEKVLRKERIEHWLKVGAKPSPRVLNLLISERIIKGKKIPVHKEVKEEKKESRKEIEKEKREEKSEEKSQKDDSGKSN